MSRQPATALATAFNAANDTGRGIFPFVTVWGSEPNTYANGKPRVNVALINANRPRSAKRCQSFQTSARSWPAQRAPAKVHQHLQLCRLNTGMTSKRAWSQVAYHLTTKARPFLPGPGQCQHGAAAGADVPAGADAGGCRPTSSRSVPRACRHQRSGTACANWQRRAQATGRARPRRPSYAWIMDVGLSPQKLSRHRPVYHRPLVLLFRGYRRGQRRRAGVQAGADRRRCPQQSASHCLPQGSDEPWLAPVA